MEKEKLGKFEAICLVLIIVINEIVLNIPNLIILSTGSSAILNTIYVSIIALLLSLLIIKLFKKFPGSDILDICHYVGGNALKVIIGIAFIIFFLTICSLGLRYLSNGIKIIYFNNSPLVYLLLFLIIPAVVLNKYGLKTISGVNVVFIFIVIFSLLFLLFASYSNFSFSKIFPIFGNSINETFFLGATNIFAYTGLAYILFLPPLLKDSKDFKKVTITSIILTSICLIFSISSLLFAIPFITKSDELLSVYLLTRMIGIGQFLERLDSIFIFVWLLSLLSSLTITSFYVIRIIKKLINIQDEKVLSPAIGLIILSGAAIIKSYTQIRFLANYVYKYSFIILVIGIGFTILFLANLKYKKLNKP